MQRPRPTTPEDVPGILTLVREAFAEYGCVLDAENEETHLLAPGPYFRERGGEFWVVEAEGRVAATVAVVLLDDAAELRSLYVHSSQRRQGWGRELTQWVLDFAHRAGRRRLILWSDTRFANAHKLYVNMGFAQEGQRELNDSNNTVEYGFSLEL